MSTDYRPSDEVVDLVERVEVARREEGILIHYFHATLI